MDITKRIKIAKLLMNFTDIPTDKGTLIIEGELTVGVEAHVEVDGEVTVAQDGEYEYDNSIITIEGGLISSIVDKGVPTEEPTEEPVVEDEPMATEEPTEEPVIEEPVTDEKDAEIEALKAENEALKAKIAELETEIEDLKSQPTAEPIEETFKNVEKKNETKIDYSTYFKKK